MIALAYRDMLTPVVADELDQLVLGIRQYLYTEHHDDGTHAAVTADSLAITSPDDFLTCVSSAVPQTPQTLLTVGQGTYTDGTGTTLRRVVLTAPAGLALGGDDDPIMRWGVIQPASDAPVSENQVYHALAVMGRLQLNGQGSYTPSGVDVSALDTGLTSDPQYSVYRLTPTADSTIHGIYVGESVINGPRGHVLVLKNDSAFVITFGTGVVTNAQKILGTPTAIGPKGCVLLVYDSSNLGWQIVSQYWGPNWQTYTPTWTSTGTAPAIGNGALLGQYCVQGPSVSFWAVMGAGSTTTFGTGTWKITLPVPMTSVGLVAPTGMRSVGFDVSAGSPYEGLVWRDSASQTRMIVYTPGSSTQWGPSAPFTWASADQWHIGGTYRLGS